MIWQGVVCSVGQGLGRNDDVLLLSLWRTQPRSQEQNSGPEFIALALNPPVWLFDLEQVPSPYTQDGAVGGGLMSGPWGHSGLEACGSQPHLASAHWAAGTFLQAFPTTAQTVQVRTLRFGGLMSLIQGSAVGLGPHRGNVESQTSALTSTT